MGNARIYPAIMAVVTLGACSSEIPDEDSGITNVDPGAAARQAEEPVLAESPETGSRLAMETTPGAGQSDPAVETRYATAVILAANESNVSGELAFREESGSVTIEGTVSGLEPGSHGLHVHEDGACGPDASGAGGHFSVGDDPHGSPENRDDRHHIGDLGNITANSDGVAEFRKVDTEMTLGTGENTILYRAVIVHEGEDDFVTQPAGDSGARIGCGIVQQDIEPAF